MNFYGMAIAFGLLVGWQAAIRWSPRLAKAAAKPAEIAQRFVPGDTVWLTYKHNNELCPYVVVDCDNRTYVLRREPKSIETGNMYTDIHRKVFFDAEFVAVTFAAAESTVIARTEEPKS